MLQMILLSCLPYIIVPPLTLSLDPFFLSRAFSGSLSGIASAGARCWGVGDLSLSVEVPSSSSWKGGKKNQTKSENRCTSSGRQEVPGLSLAGLPGVQGCGGARPGSRAWHLSMLARGRRPESPVPCWVTSDRQPYPGSWSAPGARLGQGPGTLGLLSWHLRAVLRLTWGGGGG